jgi:hypothetical protein
LFIDSFDVILDVIRMEVDRCNEHKHIPGNRTKKKETIFFSSIIHHTQKANTLFSRTKCTSNELFFFWWESNMVWRELARCAHDHSFTYTGTYRNTGSTYWYPLLPYRYINTIQIYRTLNFYVTNQESIIDKKIPTDFFLRV